MQKDTLFLATTRPAMVWGVPLEGFILNMTCTCIVGMVLGSPLYWLIGVVLHFPMKILTELDHNFFRLGYLWSITKANATGSARWGGSMLSPLPCGMPRNASEISGSA